MHLKKRPKKQSNETYSYPGKKNSWPWPTKVSICLKLVIFSQKFDYFRICKTFSNENAQLCNMTTMAYHVSFDLNDGVIDHVLQLYETPEVSHIVEPTISHSSASQTRGCG